MNTNHPSSVDIDSGLSLIAEGIETVSKQLFSTSLNNGVKENHSYTENNQPWFDDDCRRKRSEFYRFLNIFRKEKIDVNRGNMVTARSLFKRSLKDRQAQFSQFTNRAIK